MGKIVLLDDLTINKIAAGEVIERPASVVKEIVENSIDAGATNVTVEIRNGGISYIRVTDNGKGIMQDDMEIAFERHATSKLRSAEDLDEIKSMGFRGEALASIAAIARVELVSKTRESDNGYKVVIEGGNILEEGETGCPNGTSITVENLFFNTPVRYKFLKKDFTESGYIEDVITRIALVHPEIAIKLINTGKTIIQTSGNGDLKAVIYNIYGKDIAQNLIDINYNYEDMIISGVIGKPVISRSNRSNQLFFVNKRFVKDKTLSGAAEQAFKGFVTVGKHGFLVLNIEMDPRKVDVNVHPAKLEVRFQEENLIFKAVYHAIKDGLTREDLVASTSSIEGIDKNKVNNQDKIDTFVKESSTTTFREIMGNTQNSNNIDSVVSNSGNVYNPTEEEKIAKEERDAREFDEVINKLQKMQNMIKIANGEISQKEEQEKDVSLTETQEADIKAEIKEEKHELAENIKVENQEIRKEETTAIKDYLSDISREENLKSATVEKEKVTDELAVENDIKVKTDVPTPEENLEQKLQKINELKEQIAKEVPQNNEVNNDEEFLQMYEKMFGTAIKKKDPEEEKNDVINDFKPITKADNISVFESESKYSLKPAYKYIGIAFNTYIIIEMNSELYIIDQHAAHERIMYEQIKKNYYNDDKKDSQLMLLPDVITLTHKEMGIYKDNREMFKKAGFMVEEFGENTVKLTGVPNVLIDLETKELFLEALDEINTVARTAKQEIEEKFIATVACKAAVKAHMALAKDEVEKLLDELLVLPNPFTCPHGRPTAIRMTKNDIEKKFSRR